MDPSPSPCSGVLGVMRAALGVVSEALGILWEALRIPARNCKLSLAVLTLVLVPYSLLHLAYFFALASLSPAYLTANVHPLRIPTLRLRPVERTQPHVAMDDDASLAAVVAAIEVAFYIVQVYTVLSTIHAAYATYSDEYLSVAELFRRMRGNWKGPVATQLYVTILSIGYTHFLDLLFDAGASIALMAPGALLALPAYVLYMYLGVVWTAGLAASVAEGGGGLQALGAAQVVVRGRLLQGFLISLWSLVASLAVTGMMEGLLLLVESTTTATQVAAGLVLTDVEQVVYMFTLVAFTVFYLDCRRRHGGLAADGGLDSYRRLAHGPPPQC
uniref:Phospho-N-acetylmuramoyl-pentapeptide-transferase n=1 Tax=Anthurium amnicola TaxID=1678845 RepID=A0A1D1YGV3_9ARAE